MLLKSFPDIHWLRKQARNNFQDRRGVNNLKLPAKGWPNVVLNTTTTQKVERCDILAPFSLFMNLSGSSRVIVDGQNINLSADTFCLVNKGQIYDLLLNGQGSTTTFNIHFGEQLFAEALHNLYHFDAQLLDHPLPEKGLTFQTFQKPKWKDGHLRQMIRILQRHYQKKERNNYQDDEEFALLVSILEMVLIRSGQEMKRLQHISALKNSTKAELYKRLHLSLEYIHEYYRNTVSLDELSQIACMSKFHYLRSFKQAFFCSPHQYIMKIRLQKAEDLLISSNLTILEIADKIGFEEPNSFGRFFKKYHSCTPLTYRNLQKK